MNCDSARSIAALDHRRWQSAGGHVAEKAHRVVVTVGALSLGRVGEVVGVTVGNDQHVAGFEALRRCARKTSPAATVRDDVQRDQVLRGRKHDPPECFGLRCPRYPGRGSLDEKQHRAGQPYGAQHVRQHVEPGRRGNRSGRLVMVAGHCGGDLNAAVAVKGNQAMPSNRDMIQGMYSAFSRGTSAGVLAAPAARDPVGRGRGVPECRDVYEPGRRDARRVHAACRRMGRLQRGAPRVCLRRPKPQLRSATTRQPTKRPARRSRRPLLMSGSCAREPWSVSTVHGHRARAAGHAVNALETRHFGVTETGP